MPVSSVLPVARAGLYGDAGHAHFRPWKGIADFWSTKKELANCCVTQCCQSEMEGRAMPQFSTSS
jgi:hypothetical protein